MKFQYIRARDFDHAIETLAEDHERLKILAGGTDLLVMVRQNKEAPRSVLDITPLNELKAIEIKGEEVEMGALVTHTQVCEFPLLTEQTVALVQACREVGSPQIQNRGTLGGNLANASPAADTIPPLYVFQAVLTLGSRQGERKIKVEDFCTEVKRSVLRPDEMILRISFPLPSKGSFSFFKKLGQRKAMNISKVSIAACLEFDGDTIGSIRVALGAVGPTVIRAVETESYLQGKTLSEDAIEAVAGIIRRESRAISDIRSTADYRNAMTGVLLAAGLREAMTSRQN